MDNVIQNVSIEDIIPNRLENLENEEEIKKIFTSIKEYGIIEPILTRQKDGKYQIITGNDKYRAAQRAGLNMIPIIIKNMDDKTYNKYLNKTTDTISQTNQNTFIQSNNNNEFLNNIKTSDNLDEVPLENKILKFDNINTNNYDKDIVNLRDLNKKEYERNEFIMNNQPINPNIMNQIPGQNNNQGQNVNPPVQEPAFGGKFFPSLEDEPTNMNMGIPNPIPTPAAPQITPANQPNNLIDLTDDSTTSSTPVTPSFINPTPQVAVPSTTETTQPLNNPLNIEALQATNPSVTPAPEITPAFDMSQSITPQPIEMTQTPNQPITPEPTIQSPIDIATPTMNSTPNIPLPDLNTPINPIKELEETPESTESINQSTVTPPELPTNPETVDTIPQSLNISSPESITSTPSPEPIILPNDNSIPQKDITPVVTSIKLNIESLKLFGFNITTNEEENSTSYKITIEIPK